MATPLEKWVEEVATLTQPDKIYWCDGTEEEARRLINIGINEEKLGGRQVFYELNPETYPNCYLHRSHPNDVARAEHLTFVCHKNKEDAGPNNN
ncbi:MAG: phosphoenolpyruvate carboxykinase (GTP), partial [Candidatus Bathyanammoxibius sp.]